MLSDSLGTFSDNQAITGDAASTNVVDLGATGTPKPGHANALDRDIGRGNMVNIRLQVTESFNTLTSLDVTLETDTADSFGSATVVWEIDAVPLATLVAGYVFPINDIPRYTVERYLRFNYNVNGSNPSTGKLWAAIVDEHQDWIP